MSIDRIVMAFAGAVVFIATVLAYVHSPYWLIATGFVGLNLFQAAFTGFCPLGADRQSVRRQARTGLRLSIGATRSFGCSD